MKAERFIECLKEACPSGEILEDYGLEGEDIKAIRSTFIAERRKESKDLAPEDEFLRMASTYDCTLLEIGLIRIASEPVPYESGTLIALCEADPIVLRADGSIAMHNHASTSSAPLECADNSERLLDALAVFIAARRERMRWRGRTEDVAISCADAAGGRRYLQFFRIVCSMFQN